MGLTVHYNIESSTKSPNRPFEIVKAMRELAMDLPFEEVSEIYHLKGNDCNYEIRREELAKSDHDADQGLFWLLIQASEHITAPDGTQVSVAPEEMIVFSTWPGHGSESANFGLCRYPEETTYINRYAVPVISSNPEIYAEKIPTKLGKKWCWGSFCKTQYASSPECGGLPNFIKCHVALITLLERISELKTIKVEINDEGHYGSSTYSDDWKEAREAGREPTYVFHEATHSIEELSKSVGEYNGMIAAIVGAFKDALGDGNMNIVSPITEYSNFEQIEAKGAEKMEDMLNACAKMAQEIRDKIETNSPE